MVVMNQSGCDQTRAQSKLPSLDQIRILHPGRNVAHAVEHVPDIDVIASLHVENQVRIFFQRPATQAEKVQFARIARCARIRMAANVAELRPSEREADDHPDKGGPEVARLTLLLLFG